MNSIQVQDPAPPDLGDLREHAVGRPLQPQAGPDEVPRRGEQVLPLLLQRTPRARHQEDGDCADG